MAANSSKTPTLDVRYGKRITALLAIAILVFPISSSAAKPKSVVIQSEELVTSQEREAIKSVAKRFVRRMMETRDLAPLLNEFFPKDFISLYTKDPYENISDGLYRQLSDKEKIRLFVAQINHSYLMVLEMMSDPDSGTRRESSFRRIFPERIAKMLDPSPETESMVEITNLRQLLDGLVKLEKALVEARVILRRKKLEKTLAFRKDLASSEQDRYGIGYRVRALVGTEPMIDKRGVTRFHPGQKIFRVETPIFYGIIFVKVGENYKILFLGPADGD
jgi:hypothetical protein